ncbi:collagen binding domain-containing protein [Leifsonia sp. NPDC058230]|uniref:MSCRAMM family protein n=1 Tax=Leifsonia sp. NPDC058230 TaxID=3346391 RepID=UPI0036DAAE06
MRLRPRVMLLALIAAVAAPFFLSTSASAATTSLWAGWAPSTGIPTTVTVATKPLLTANVTTDSRAGQVGVISGSSVWLPQGSPVGAKYGSSINQPYLNLRPRADNSSSPSTTTYAFTTPTPPSGWTFVLGDIDADQVQVRAIGPDGVALTANQLGFRGGFNYCAPGVAGKPSCTGSATDVAIWNPATATLSGNAAALDTSGAAGWFEPTAPISSLSFVFTQRSGLPVYQTWFASLARDITGTVADAVSGPLDGVALTLTDRNGRVVGSATTAGGGAYSFPGFLATDGYTVSITPPAGKIAVGMTSKPADLTTTDAVVDFTVRDLVPVAVSGTVRDNLGNPVPNVTVDIPGTGAVTTGPDGTYLFDTVGVGMHTVAVPVAPAGYTVSTTPQTISVVSGVETPIENVDFVLTANPSISGTVTASGGGVAGVTVTATPNGGGSPVSTVTAADGTYTFPLIAAGGYSVSVGPPAGYIVSGVDSRAVTVATADVLGIDFALARTGSVSGLVADSVGAPIAGATLTVTGTGAPATLTTNASGAYSLGSLPPGTYTVALTVPAGYSGSGALTRTVTITAAGEAIVDQDFAVIADPAPPVGPGTSNGTGSGAAPAPTGELAATGSDDEPSTALLAAGMLLSAGAAAAIVSSARRRRVARARGRTPSHAETQGP